MIGISRDITECKRAEEREEFLHSLLRHDVRNKAHIVQGYLGVLADTDLSENQEDLVEKAMENSEQGIDIIKKVRTLTEIKENEIRNVNLGSILGEHIDSYRDRASQEGIEIEYEDFDFEVQGGSLLEELFNNLLENSIVHSGCGKIQLRSEKREGEYVITVEDEGKGVSDEDKERIFEKGFKGSETGGSGLGMYLVKRIAESYGGRVEVLDSELGGARFDVHLKESDLA